MQKCKTIAIANQKGGVGKTTTTFSLGVALANEGKKVLLIDADPQGNLTTYLGFYEDENAIPITLSNILENEIKDKNNCSKEAILHHKEGVDLIPSNINLSMTETKLPSAMNRECIMKNSLKELKKEYDYILIDCAPSLTMLTINALSMADKVIIPVQSQYLSAVGVGNLLQTISKVRRQINENLEVGGILLTLVDKRTNLSKEIKTQLENSYGNIVNIYESQIPIAIKTAETTSRGKSIFAYDKNSKVAKAYSLFAKEVLNDDYKERRKNALTQSYDR